MKVQSTIGLFAGISTLVTSVVHALIAWPFIRSLLRQYDVSVDVLGWVRLTWYWASVSLVVMGAIVLRESVRVFHGFPVQRYAVIAIAISEILVGGLALFVAFLHPFALLLISLGLLTSCLLLGGGSVIPPNRGRTSLSPAPPTNNG